MDSQVQVPGQEEVEVTHDIMKKYVGVCKSIQNNATVSYFMQNMQRHTRASRLSTRHCERENVKKNNYTTISL